VDNFYVVNRLLKAATTVAFASNGYVPLDCVAALLAFTASSLALAVTSRAFEVFHTEW
jgi:hypothetical protein